MGPFDLIKSVNEGKDIMTDALVEHEYNAFLTNMNFSLFPDTILQSNMMNCNSHLSSKLQYKYYMNTIRPKKRFAKWPKKEKITGDNIRLIQEVYKYSVSKAKQALLILSDEQIQWIKEKQEKGG